MLEASIGVGSTPDLSGAQLDLLFAIATVKDDRGEDQWTSESLSRAAATGWQWKAGLVADQFELGAGSGKTLKQNQWFEQCMKMATNYATGAFVVGEAVLPPIIDEPDDAPFLFVGDFLSGGSGW